jgi:hypothetical protein
MSSDTDDVERRLRSAYAASAALVDEWPASAADMVSPLARRRDSRALLLVAAAIGVVVVAGIAVGATVAFGPRTTSQLVPAVASSAPSPTAGSSALPPWTSPRTGPARPLIGVAYAFDLYTHCGIDFTTFGGRAWQAVTSLPDPERLPDAHGMTTYTGYISGTMALADQNTLRFTVDDTTVAMTGRTIVFRPVSTGPSPCG